MNLYQDAMTDQGHRQYPPAVPSTDCKHTNVKTKSFQTKTVKTRFVIHYTNDNTGITHNDAN